jgi:energy-coupling factor transporter ATP-binding protein EcfA2
VTQVSTDSGRFTVVQWDEFARMFKRAHKQGEHVSIVGQTGSGKSVLGLALCQVIATRKGKDGRPARVVVLGTKPRDDTMSALGWPIVKKWPPSFGQEACVVWPRGGDPDTMPRRQRAVFRPLMNTIFHEGGQTIYIDEAGYFEDPQPDGLGLSTTMKQFWTTARGLKLTLVAATQRPRHVTRAMWSEPSWVFIFAPDDEDDLKRVAELSGSKEQVLEIAPQLGGHEFLCIRRQRSEGVKRLYVSKVGTK